MLCIKIRIRRKKTGLPPATVWRPFGLSRLKKSRLLQITFGYAIILPNAIYYIYPSELCGTARSAAIFAKTQYKGVSVMESKDGKKRLLQCVLCLLAIFVPLIIIELLFEKVYVFEWVFNHGYLFLFAVAAIISYFAAK